MICPTCRVCVGCPLCGGEEAIESSVSVSEVGGPVGAPAPRFWTVHEQALYDAWNELRALAMDGRHLYQSEGPAAARRQALNAAVLLLKVEKYIDAAEEERA